MSDLVVPADVVYEILSVVSCRNLKKPASSQGIIFENKNDELWVVAFSDTAFAARRLEKPLGLDYMQIPAGKSICMLPVGGVKKITKYGYLTISLSSDGEYRDDWGVEWIEGCPHIQDWRSLLKFGVKNPVSSLPLFIGDGGQKLAALLKADSALRVYATCPDTPHLVTDSKDRFYIFYPDVKATKQAIKTKEGE